jgi:predicted dithiol-disulfide oxidoreductase (DUF899 family)
MSRHQRRFPNESSEYRAARDDLLDLEVGLREQIEQVAKARRALPVGGALPEDYEFRQLDRSGRVQPVRLSELFTPASDTLLLYSFMFGPEMEKPCPACTSLIDGFNGLAWHILDRLNLAIVAKSPIERVLAFGSRRGWDRVPFVSSAETPYNSDYHAENDDGEQIPAMNVFVRRDGEIRHFWGSELLYADLPGHPRHMDLMWPIWNLFDLTPEGRGTDWFPKLEY